MGGVLGRLGLLAVVVLAAAATPAAASSPKLPDPTYPSVVSQEQLVQMDDGVQIATTVTFPSLDGKTPAPGRFPAVLAMTPYGRTEVCGCPDAKLFATRGMVSVVADVRGTGGSGGDLSGNFFSPREARDGYDLVEHFGTQPWSSGKVGMAGGSYVGITQYLTAEQRPPHLAAITPMVAISDLYRDGYAHGGIPNLLFDGQYIAVQGAPGYAGVNTDPYLLQQTLAAKLGQSAPGTIAFDYLARPDDDDFYRERSPIYHAADIAVPVLDIGEWHDGLLRGETEMYAALSKRRGVETRLFMDPCTHKGCGPPLAPLTDQPGRDSTDAVIFEFLAKYLQSAKTPDRPPVRFYLQGAGGYVDADTWPPAGTTMRRYPLGPGALGTPATGTASYVTNPLAGFSMAFDDYGTVAATPYVPTDQRLEGPQGLTFRTPTLESPLDLTGPLALHLRAASTATDTDWYAKVADVAPDGSESIVAEGALRASHRALDPAKSTPARPYHTHTDPQPIDPGKVYDYDVEIWPTAYRFAAGHRLQLRLTSTDLPTHLPGSFRIDRAHPETARVDLLPPAVNTVTYDGSYLALPVRGPAPTACARRPASRRVRLRRGRSTVRVSVGVPNATVTLRGAGARRRVKTGANGRAAISVKARRSARVTVRAVACAGRLRVAVRTAHTS